jgi:hypothetical protein
MTAMPGFLQTVSLPNCFMLFVICDFLSARTKLMSFRARLMSFQALPFSVISSAAYVISSAARNPDVRLQNEFQTRFTSFGIKISPHCVRRNDMPALSFRAQLMSFRVQLMSFRVQLMSFRVQREILMSVCKTSFKLVLHRSA